MTDSASTPRRRRVLIVSPNFAPLNTPDMQRTRLALPHLRELGWEPVVLAVIPEHSGTGVLDPLLEKTYPADIRIVRARGISPHIARRIGIGSLWWRCGGALRRAGDALLQTERFDLIFFTTTVFDAFSLGPRWLRRFGVPYVLDYQDPWVNSYYQRTQTRPPGGWLKYGVTQWAARRREPKTVRDAGAIVSVSGSYRDALITTYPFLKPSRMSVLPFGASPVDFAIAREHTPVSPLIDFHDGNFHHVYTGRCGPDMALALTIVFRAFRRFLTTHPEAAGRMRFHFAGTDYAPPPRGRESVIPIANAEGVRSYVSEYCGRVPYFDALHYLTHAHALIVVGSDDPSYSASKIYPYVLARRSTLLVLRAESPVATFAEQIAAGICCTFGGASDADAAADRVYQNWFLSGGHQAYRGFNEEKFAPFTSANMTRRLTEVFESVVPSAAAAC